MRILTRRRPALLPALLVGCVLALGACDSNDPSDPGSPAAFVGTWAPDSVISRTLATAARDVRIVDFSAPGTGTLAASGAVTGALRYVDGLSSDGDGNYRYVVLTSYGNGSTQQYPLLRLTLDNLFHEAYLQVQRETHTETYSVYGVSGNLFTYTNGRVVVSPRTLTGSAGTVTVGGTLDLVAREIAAGAEGLLYEERDPFYFDSEALHYVFEEDGAFHLDEITGDVTRRHTGTWEQLDDARVRVSLPWEGGEESTVFTVARQGSVLSMSYTSFTCDETPCLDDYARDYRLAAGSFSRVRRALTYRFSPAEAARPAARPADGGATRDVLWPRRPVAG